MRSQISSDPPSKREMQEEYSSSFTALPFLFVADLHFYEL